MNAFFTPRRAATIAVMAQVLLLSTVTACSDSAPLAPEGSPNGADAASLAAQVAANDSLIKSAQAAQSRTTEPTPTGNRSAASADPLGLPASLALTAAQQQQIQALRDQFAQQNAKDVEALEAIGNKARAARASGASTAVIDSIIATGADIRGRLEQANAALLKAIDAVLTPAQRDWLAQCSRGPTYTSEQAQQIAALHQAYLTANAADLAAIDKALADIMALRASGTLSTSTESQIRAILDQVSAARTRVFAAQQKLAADIAKVAPPPAACQP